METKQTNNTVVSTDMQMIYEAPVIDVVEIIVEKGFQASGGPPDMDSPSDEWSY